MEKHEYQEGPIHEVCDASTSDTLGHCYCWRSDPIHQTGERVETAPVPGDLQAPLVDLVRRFSEALLAKLVRSEQKYGWHNGWTQPLEHWDNPLPEQLVEHVEKGDPLDVAAYAAFAWHHGGSTTPESYPLKGEAANRRAEAIEHQAERIARLEQENRHLREQLATMTADRNLYRDEHEGDCPFAIRAREAEEQLATARLEGWKAGRDAAAKAMCDKCRNGEEPKREEDGKWSHGVFLCRGNTIRSLTPPETL